MATGDIYEVVVGGTLHGQATRNVLHFRDVDGSASLNTLLTEVKNCITSALLGAISADWQGAFVSGKKIYPSVGLQEEVSMVGNNGTGLQALPSFVATLLSLHTTKPGRSGRGRVYLAGPQEQNTSNGQLEAAAITAFTAFVTCLVGKFISGTIKYDWGVVSRVARAATPSAPANWFSPVTFVTLDKNLATQRSRKLGRGI